MPPRSLTMFKLLIRHHAWPAGGVTAEFAPGTMTALMGESGAGKTTLLDVIAGYKTGGHITGSIRINGKEKDVRTWKSLAAYCEQSDIHAAKLSLRESIRYDRNIVHRH